MEIPLLVMPEPMSQILKPVDFTKVQKSRYLENKILFFLQIEKVGISKPYTHLLHPAHFSLRLALCNTLNVIRTKIPTPKSIFGQIWVEKVKVVRFA